MTTIRSAGLALSLTFSSFAFAQSALDRELPTPPPHPGVVDQLMTQVEGLPAGSAARPERFSEFVLSTVGPIPLAGEAAAAGISQWINSPEEWGQGWKAYGKRFGSNLAYNGIRQTVTYGGSLALGEDNRYFAAGQSGFWPRARHAVLSTFIAHHADGRESFSFSATAGVIAAAGISSVWGPERWKGPGNIAGNAALSFASTAAFNVVREFLPSILRRSRKTTSVAGLHDAGRQ